ncbi:DNA primase [Candidatus Erwinia haradaeae]|uniref:DNA primase n=1 Tax=Candidatus Erwinia haradaeae TaxID=1922217 RepID=A0A451CZT3_9GAMM|nr:DNA primase [Candidatus Erwinia haradaeae]VFP78671.1 DNA primase [Candidatus Erwinia haradaeae]
MTGRIPVLFIKNLLERTDIVSFINCHIKLKKLGKNYNACCPFHNEKTPSFTVNREKQFYHCFGCGAHGNVIDFLIHYEHLNFIESIEELANIHGLKVPNNKSNPLKQPESYQRPLLYQLMNKLSKFYQHTLLQQPISGAYSYLTHRGISNKIIQYFSIGFAPPGWNNVLKYFGRTSSQRQLLMNSGMLITNNQKWSYDRFRDRIMFPIHDKRGRVIGFGGRAINNERPKYLNSPETEIFHKGRHLYGLYEALTNNPKPRKLLVVEGYMDVLTLTQFGVCYAVASLGTSTTSEHVHMLFRLTDTVICCYDGDKAGYQAAWRTLIISLPYMNDGRTLHFMFLPNNEDPDTLVRKEGKESFEKRMDNATPLSVFLLNTLISKVDLSFPEGRARLSSLALPLVHQIPGSALRVYLRQELGNRLGLLDDKKLDHSFLRKEKNKESIINPSIKHITIRILTSLLIHQPNLVKTVPNLDRLESLEIPGILLFIDLVKTCITYPDLNTGQLLELYRGTKFIHYLERLVMWNHMVIDEQIETMFLDSLRRIYNYALERKLEELIAYDRSNGLSSEEKRVLWKINKALKK